MAGAIAIPAAIEVARSPADNLVRDTRREVNEAIIEPARRKIQTAYEDLSRSIEAAAADAVSDVATGLMGRLFSVDIWKLVFSLFRLLGRFIKSILD